MVTLKDKIATVNGFDAEIEYYYDLGKSYEDCTHIKDYDVYLEIDVKEAVLKLLNIIENTEVNKYMMKLHIKEIFGDFENECTN